MIKVSSKSGFRFPDPLSDNHSADWLTLPRQDVCTVPFWAIQTQGAFYIYTPTIGSYNEKGFLKKWRGKDVLESKVQRKSSPKKWLTFPDLTISGYSADWQKLPRQYVCSVPIWVVQTQGALYVMHPYYRKLQ